MGFGSLPMRGSPAATSSQARMAAVSKSGELIGSSCQPVTAVPKTDMERMFGNSRRRLSWCSAVVAIQTPSSGLPSRLSRRMRTILSSTYTARQPNIGRVMGFIPSRASSTNPRGSGFFGFGIRPSVREEQILPGRLCASDQAEAGLAKGESRGSAWR